MKRNLKNLFFPFFLAIAILITPGGVDAAESFPNPQVHALFKEGIAKAFNMEEKEANRIIEQAIALDRENPLGYSLLAMTRLFFHEMSFSAKERQERKEDILRYASEAIAKAENRIKNNPKEGQAYFALSLAKMALVRLYIAEKNYWAVAREASNIWDYLEKAREDAPQNYDIYFAMGVLHFHLDQLPGVTRFLSSLWITSGNQKKGIEELEVAAKKGDLLKDLAKSELVSVYLNFEGKPELALPYARELRNQYPQNYNFTIALASVLADLKRFTAAFSLAEEIARGIQSGAPPYRPELASRYDLLMGRIFFGSDDFAKSEEFLRKVLSNPAPYNARNRAWAYVRLGMIADLQKARKKAEDCYQKALDVQGGEGSAQVLARQYLKTPYVKTRQD